MAIGWLAVLKSVPWTDVISNAPKLAEGARKLWRATAGKGGAPDAATDAQPESAAQARIDALAAAVADLQEQMRASSALIKALAEQNTQLVRHLEAMRRRMILLGLAGAVSVVAALGALVVAWP